MEEYKLHFKPGQNALETRTECIVNQDRMHWKPGQNALETRTECIVNQDRMHWKPGCNTALEPSGMQGRMHSKHQDGNALITSQGETIDITLISMVKPLVFEQY